MKKNGFTLVELLAVIVILAIILVIAVPRITNTINSARKGAIESTLMMVAARAETEYMVASTLGDSGFDAGALGDEVACGTWANLDASQYTGCEYYIDANGTAHVVLNGTADGKFDGFTCTAGTRASATCTKA